MKKICFTEPHRSGTSVEIKGLCSRAVVGIIAADVFSLKSWGGDCQVSKKQQVGFRMVLKLPFARFPKSMTNFQAGRSLHCSEHRKVLNRRSSRCNSLWHTTLSPTRRCPDAAEWLFTSNPPLSKSLEQPEVKPSPLCRQTLQRRAWSQQHCGLRFPSRFTISILFLHHKPGKGALVPTDTQVFEPLGSHKPSQIKKQLGISAE